MKATVSLINNISFEGIADSGHKVVIDAAAEHGGENLGSRPMELMLLGMGGCTAIDVVTILRKGRQDVSDCRVHLEAERASEVRKVFTRIHAHYVVSGKDLTDAAVKRAVELSAHKYCSATIMLAKTAEVTHDYEVVGT